MIKFTLQLKNFHQRKRKDGNDYLRNTKLNLNLETIAEWAIRAGLSQDKNILPATVQRERKFIKRLEDAYGWTKDYVN